MRHSTVICSLVALSLSLVNGKVLNSLDELPPNEKYDFVIVGSGPGGTTVASRLSENPNFKVLLVEAGQNNDGILDIQIPARNSQANAVYDWDYLSTPQSGLNNRVVNYTQGRVLGGGSSINGMVYTRGPSDDFDLWAKVTGDDGWSWKKLLPYIKKNERWVPPPGGRNATGEYNPEVHGYEGNIPVSLSWGAATSFDNRALRNAELQKEFPFNLDYNSGNPLGIGWCPWTIGNGERSTAATGYLPPTIRARPNLTILLNTYALRVLESTRNLDFRTVELGVLANPDRPTVKVTATKEAIISAGAFGTPRILLSSGIGDRSELDKVGVKTLHHLPDVGKNLADHISTGAAWTAQTAPRPPVDPARALEEWQTTRTGPLSEPHASHQIFWAKIPADAGVWDEYEDPAAGPRTPHIEVIPAEGAGMASGLVVLLTPYSRGSVKINSTNAYQKPVVDLGFLTHPFDLEALKEGVRLTKRFFSGPAWEGYIGQLVTADPDGDPAAFEAEVRNGAFGLWHPTGTARMSKRGEKGGVVDPELRVKGVRGLRIVDSSVLPHVPAAHTQVPTYVLAERISDLIKEAWRRG